MCILTNMRARDEQTEGEGGRVYTLSLETATLGSMIEHLLSPFLATLPSDLFPSYPIHLFLLYSCPLLLDTDTFGATVPLQRKITSVKIYSACAINNSKSMHSSISSAQGTFGWIFKSTRSKKVNNKKLPKNKVFYFQCFLCLFITF